MNLEIVFLSACIGFTVGFVYIFINQYPPICYGDCSICLNQLYSDQDLDTLPCGHHFHDMCIHLWYDRGDRTDRLTCPLCRKQCGVRHTIIHYFPLMEKYPIPDQN